MNAKAEEAAEGEVVSAESSINQALMQITKGEIDQQIETAHRYPRSIAKFQKRALEMVTLDEETAESCLYNRPVGKNFDGTQKFAEGMSIRMAEIVGSCYGNLRVGAMLVEMTERYVKARGFAHDLETNFGSTSEVVESTVDKHNRPFSERMRVVVAKAALAKARRDATFSVVPRALCKRLEADARQTAIGDATTLAKRRGAVMQWVGKLGIDPARVFAAINVTGEADLGLDQLATLTGIKTAIKDGDTTIDEAFPALEGTPDAKTRAQAAKDALRQGNGAPAPKPDTASSGHIPQFDAASAEKALRACKDLKALETVMHQVREDYRLSKRELPLEATAAYDEMKPHLTEAAAKGAKQLDL